MDDIRQSIVFDSTDFLSNLFGVNLNTHPSANDYMQYMHPTHLYNETRSSSNAFEMNTTPPQFESNDQPQLQQRQSPRRNPPRNRHRRHFETRHHYGN